MVKQATIFLLGLILISCSGQVSEQEKGKMKYCTDSRDNTTFSFITDDIKNIKINLDGSGTFEVTTTDGEEMSLGSHQESYINCKTVIEH